MKTLKHPFFIVCLLIWLTNQLLELNSIFIWPLYSYLDDLLCFPLILTFILAVERTYFNDYTLIIPVTHTVFAVAAFTICFELILPLFRDKYTADVLDVFAYSAGALSFQVLVNRPLISVSLR